MRFCVTTTNYVTIERKGKVNERKRKLTKLANGPSFPSHSFLRDHSNESGGLYLYKHSVLCSNQLIIAWRLYIEFARASVFLLLSFISTSVPSRESS